MNIFNVVDRVRVGIFKKVIFNRVVKKGVDFGVFEEDEKVYLLNDFIVELKGTKEVQKKKNRGAVELKSILFVLKGEENLSIFGVETV